MPEQHTFLYISLPLFCTTMFLLARFIRFMEEIPYVLTCSWLVRGCFCRCCCFLFFFFFFTAAHYNLGRCLFPHRAARKLSCSSSNEIYDSFAVFISRSSSFFCYQRQCSHQNLFSRRKDSDLLLLLLFPSKSPVAMRFTAKTRGCLKCKNSP